jgi:opine dehydrogenase
MSGESGSGRADRRVAVLGAGAGGCAAAADLSQRGFEVRLYSRSEERLEPIRARGGLEMSGVLGARFVDVALVTSDLTEAVDGAGVIVISVPITGLAHYAEVLPPRLADHQIVMLNPGHMGGGLYFAHRAREVLGEAPRNLCETATLTYAARLRGPAEVGIYTVASNLLFAALPASGTERLRASVAELFPAIVAAGDVLQTGFADLNAVEHPAQTVCNAGWLEHTRGDYYFYREGTTPAVARVIEAVDRERLALAAAFGVPARSFVESFHSFGYTTAEAAATGRVYDAMQASEPNRNLKGPSSLDHRYLHEDVGWGLVPWIHLAQAAGVEVATMRALTALASTMNGVDYLGEGLTLARMGLAGLDRDGVRAYVTGKED